MAYYAMFLGRTGDAAGVQFWVNALEHGGSGDLVIGTLLGTAEYGAKIH